MKEKEIINKVYKNNPYVFRNDNGIGYRKNGQRFTYGLMPGTGDLIGFEIITIDKSMIGKQVGIFKSIEVKTINDRLSDKQVNWHNLMLKLGCKSEIWKENLDGEIEIIDTEINP